MPVFPAPDDCLMIQRFYLRDREVTQSHWVRVERQAGFHPKGFDNGQPATGGFSAGGYRGSSHYAMTRLVDDTEYECSNCKEPCMLVEEWDINRGVFETFARHWDSDYPENAGPRECDLELTHPVATILV